MKQTKNPLTRQEIERELYALNKADIRAAAVMLGVTILILAPIASIITVITVSATGHFAIKAAIIIITDGLSLVPVAAMLVGVIHAFTDRKLLQNGGFDIVTRELQYKEEKIVGRHLERFFHFQGFYPTTVGTTTYQLADQGDEYYIVHYKGKKFIKLIYSAKMYDLKEKQV